MSEHYRQHLFEMRKRVDAVLETMQRRAVRGPEMKRSEIYFWLEGLPVEVLLYLMAKARLDGVRKCVSLYFVQLQGIRCAINGDDLKSIGVPPGPAFKKILDRVFRARLDNEALTRDDELRIAKKEAKVYRD